MSRLGTYSALDADLIGRPASTWLPKTQAVYTFSSQICEQDSKVSLGRNLGEGGRARKLLLVEASVACEAFRLTSPVLSQWSRP